MSSALHPDSFVVLPQLASRGERTAAAVPEFVHSAAAPVLNYHTSTGVAEESMVYKTLAGFAAGSLLTGLMLSCAAVAVRRLFHRIPDAGSELFMREAFLFGLAFAGASLLLVAVKVREERATVALHTRHWLMSMGTGALYSLIVFGPCLAAESAFPVNRAAASAVWIGALLFPILAAFWLLTSRAPDAPHA